MRTFRLDLPLCQEVSNCSSSHPSRRFSSTSRRLSVFNKLQDFFPKHSYGKIAATVRTMWIPVRTHSSIRQVSQFKSRRPDASQHGPDARASDMEIACIKSTISTIIPLVRTCKAFIWKLLAAVEIQTSGCQSAWSGRACIRYGNCVHQINHFDNHPIGPDVRSLYMEITCSGRATVWTKGHHRPDAAQKQERISAKFSDN
jgi:hypothetical protein